MASSTHDKQRHPSLRSAAESVGRVVNKVPGAKTVSSVWDDFKAFLNRGSVMDLAVGIIMGAAFTAVVNSVVTDLISPIIGLATNGVSLEQSFIVMRKAKNCTMFNSCDQFNTIADAQSAGAVTWNYGRFLHNVINFLIISVIVYFIVRAYSRAFVPKKVVPAATKECDYCAKAIPLKAKRCPECTTHLEPMP